MGHARTHNLGETLKQPPVHPPDDIAGAGLRAFFNIAKAWKLTEDQQLSLLGLNDLNTLMIWKSAAAVGSVKLGADARERLGELVCIWKALATLFPDNEIADQWIHRPNENPPFRGEPPLALMQLSREGLALVRDHLDARKGG